MEYGVQTHNKFAFLDEDVGAPEETLTKAEEEKKKAAAHPPEKKVTKPAVVTKTAPATIPTKEAEKHEKKDNEGGQKPAAKSRNDRGVGGGNRGRDNRDGGQNRGGGPQRQRNPQQNDRREGFDSQNDREKRMPNGRPPQNNEYNKEAGMDGRPPRRVGPPRGGGDRQRGGYGGGPRGGQRRTRNEQKEENKVEDSKSNEGENTVEKPAEENEAGEVTDGQQKVNDENVDNNGGDEKKGDQEEEVVPRGKTYEEYKAELTQKQIEAVQFNTRKPGEGGDQKIYQKLVPLKKPENTKGGKSEDVHEETTQHKEKREKPLSIDVAFVDKRFGGSKTGFAGVDRNERPPPRGGDFRQGGGDRQNQRGGGGPGQGGGGRGRGPPRDNYGSGPAGPSNRRPTNKQGGGDFTLENDQFPALGAK